MKRIFAGALAALLSLSAMAATLVPIQLINPTGSSSGQVITSAGATTAPAWTTITLSGLGGLSSATAASTYLTQANAATTYGAKTGNLSQFAATTSAQLAALLTDETGTGANVFGTSPTITTPNIVGVSNGAAATAGSIGQVISSSVPAGSAVSLTANAFANVTSISLPAGMWLIWGNVVTNPAGTTNQSNTIAAISTVSASLPTAPNAGAWVAAPYTQPAAGLFIALPVGQMVVNISATTTYYLVVESNFATSTNSAYGFIGAVRIH